MSVPDLTTAPDKLSYLTIETSTWCNLACTGCSRTVGMGRQQWLNQHMSAATFASLAPHLPRASQATLNGVGEPTLNPDLPEIVRLAWLCGRLDELSMVCNGQNKDMAVYSRLRDSGLSRLHVSVDSLDPDVVQTCRKGTNLDLLVQTLDTLRQLEFPLTINVVASRYNIHDIPRTLTRLDAMGPAQVLVQEYLDLGNPDGRMEPAARDRLRAVLEAGRPSWHNLAIQLHGLVSGSVEPVCSSPWNSLAVTVEGYLTPCCVNFDPAVYGHADLTTHAFHALWGSEIVQAFLAEYLRQAPAFCGNCHMNGRPVAGGDVFLRDFVNQPIRSA